MFKRRYLISTLPLKYNLPPLKTKKIGFNGDKFKMAFVFYDEICIFEEANFKILIERLYKNE